MTTQTEEPVVEKTFDEIQKELESEGFEVYKIQKEKPVLNKLQRREVMSKIEHASKNLIQDFPFYGYITLNMKRYYTDSLDIPTMAITAKRELALNLTNLYNCSIFHIMELLKHEILHVAQRHFQRMPKKLVDIKSYTECKFQHQMLNIAMDCAINQLIQLPEEKSIWSYIPKYKVWILAKAHSSSLKSCEKMCNKELEPKREYEYYYVEFLKRQKEVEENMSEALEDFLEKLANGHTQMYGEDEDNVSQYNDTFFTNMVKKALEEQYKQDRQRGTEYGSQIEEIVDKPKVKTKRKLWQTAFKKVAGDELTDEKEVCYGRPSRRNKNSFWYKKPILMNPNVYIGVDTSGSMSIEELSEAFAYINSIMKREGISCTLIECDAAIQKVTENVKRLTTQNMKVHGRGGTDLTQIVNYILSKEGNKKCNLFVFTDGETPWKDASNIKTTCIYTKNHCKIPNTVDGGILEPVG